MSIKLNFRLIMKNPAVDSEIGFLTKSLLKPYGRAGVMPKVWELNTHLLDEPIAFSHF